MNLQSLSSRLVQYDTHEARSIVRILLEDSFGLSYTEILTDGIDSLSVQQQDDLDRMMKRLIAGEPIQYVTGKAWFCGRQFHVEPGVLIPRPETEELCEWIIRDGAYGNILDIGTGSGCIAATLKLEGKENSVTAWDISSDALRIAEKNAECLGAIVSFRKEDALHPSMNNKTRWDIIVSNPPYICSKEKAEMESNVLDYEPSQALFVPDNDPLIFYRNIAKYARQTLTPKGRLYFEINALYSREMTILLSSLGFTDITTRKDSFGKERMIKATL